LAFLAKEGTTTIKIQGSFLFTAEMWEDYRIFKAAVLLSEWRKKWAAYLPS